MLGDVTVIPRAIPIRHRRIVAAIASRVIKFKRAKGLEIAKGWNDVEREF
jgi:hypothetical protein